MDAYFEVEDVVTTRSDWNEFVRAKKFLRANRIEILSQDQVKGEMLRAEDDGNETLAKACRTVYELWDAFEE